VVRVRRAVIKPRGKSQQHYVRSIQQHDINFGIGPAGTGKTYLAVACAVAALESDQVRRILLVRPRSRPARNSASCRATSRRRSTRICAALRRALRDARLREREQADRAPRHRGLPARLHARAR